MLRITVEIIPHGDEARTRKIGEGYIANDGTGDQKYGNYNCTFTDNEGEVEFASRVEDYPREFGFWQLINEALAFENEVEEE